MANFTFALKDPKATVKTTVVLLITGHNQRAKYYTGMSINPKYWCNEPGKSNYQRAIKHPEFKEAPEFNEALDLLLLDAKKIASNLFANFSRKPTPKEIKLELEAKYRPKIESNKNPDSFFSFWQDIAENIIYRTNTKTKKPITNHTRISLLQTYRILKGFEPKAKRPVNWKNIDIAFHGEFKKYLESNLLLAGNTVAKHLANIRFMMGEAQLRKIDVCQDYKTTKFTATKEEVDSIYLNLSELKEMQELDLTHRPGLEAVRDLFLIGCWTGLRFKDYSELYRAKFTGGNIEIKTSKTKKNVVIPILDPLEKLLEKFQTEKGLNLPKSISNQKMNEALKEIAQMLPSLHTDFSINSTKAGMEVNVNKKKWQLVVTHTARRSFATNMYLKDIPVSLIMQVTGHKTERQFYNYIKIEPEESAAKFKELFNQPSKERKMA